MLINTFALLQHIPDTLLIFCRIFFALQVLPITQETKLPPIARGGLALFLTLIVYNTIGQTVPGTDINTLSFFILVMKECIVGLILGFAASLFFQVYLFVGHIVSMQGGLSMSNLFDPSSGMQVPLIGRFYYLGFCVLFMTTGGFHWFIRALVETFIKIPLTKAVFSEEIVFAMIQGVGVFFELSFKLASPIVAVIFIVDCGLGILARAVPQMNMFVIGIPLKVFILFALLFVTVGLLPAYNEMINRFIMEIFYSIEQGLIPR